MKVFQISFLVSLIAAVFSAAVIEKTAAKGAILKASGGNQESSLPVGKRRVVLSYPELVSVLSELTYENHVPDADGESVDSSSVPRKSRNSIKYSSTSSMQKAVAQLRAKGFEFEDNGNNSVLVVIPEGYKILPSEKTSCSSLLEFFTGSHDSYDALKEIGGAKESVGAVLSVAGSAISAAVGCAGSLITNFVSLVGNVLTNHKENEAEHVKPKHIPKKLSLKDIGPPETKATTTKKPKSSTVALLSENEVSKRIAINELRELGYIVEEKDGDIIVTKVGGDVNDDPEEFKDAMNRLEKAGFFVEKETTTTQSPLDYQEEVESKKLFGRTYVRNEFNKAARNLNSQKSRRLMLTKQHASANAQVNKPFIIQSKLSSGMNADTTDEVAGNAASSLKHEEVGKIANAGKVDAVGDNNGNFAKRDPSYIVAELVRAGAIDSDAEAELVKAGAVNDAAVAELVKVGPGNTAADTEFMKVRGSQNADETKKLV